jgi:hypothetical protein
VTGQHAHGVVTCHGGQTNEVKQYRDMGYEKLHLELKRLLSQGEDKTAWILGRDYKGPPIVWFNEDKRLQLLPALEAIKKLVAQPGRRSQTAGLPCWEEECRLLGIKAATVRKWKQRS